MEGEICVTPSINDEFQSWDIQGDQMEAASGFTRSIIDDIHSSDNQRDQMEIQSDFT